MRVFRTDSFHVTGSYTDILGIEVTFISGLVCYIFGARGLLQIPILLQSVSISSNHGSELHLNSGAVPHRQVGTAQHSRLTLTLFLSRYLHTYTANVSDSTIACGGLFYFARVVPPALCE